MWKIIILSLALLQTHIFAGDVLVLTNLTFDETIRDNSFVMVKFFAPWCGHCKQFEPIYNKIAKTIKNEGKPFIIAELDASLYTDIASRESIGGYPTIKFYVNGNEFLYEGERAYDDVLAFMERKTSPPATLLSTEEEVVAQKEGTEVHCLYAISKGNKLADYIEVAMLQDDFRFFYAQYEIVSKVFPEVKPNNIILFKDSEKQVIFSEEFDAEKFKNFLISNTMPVVNDMNQRTLELTFTPNGKPGIFLYYDPGNETQQAALDEFTNVAAELNAEGNLFIRVDINDELGSRLVEYLSIEASEMPTIEILVTKDEIERYKHTGGITADEIKAFINDWKTGKIPRFYKSEAEPTENPGPVFTVVGSTFDTFVLNNEKDVIVKFYAPWCGHCQALAPSYKALAEALIDNKQLVFTEVDATKNDIEGYSIESFPTIKLFPGKNKTDVITYQGNRTAVDIVKFIQEKASYPFEIPATVYDIKDVEETSEEEVDTEGNEGEDEEESEDEDESEDEEDEDEDEDEKEDDKEDKKEQKSDL